MRTRSLFPLLTILLLAGAVAVQARGAHASRVTFSRLWTTALSPNADSSPVSIGRVRFAGKKDISLLYVLAGNNGSNCSPGDPVHQAVLYAINTANGKVR